MTGTHDRHSRSARRIYAGVGARSAPPQALERIRATAQKLARGGWTLRTGLSPGADQAFYGGALEADGAIELYLPWPAFEQHARAADEGTRVSTLEAPAEEAYELAARFHPRWSGLPPSLRDRRARDVHVILGANLSSPVALVMCWTHGGELDGHAPRIAGTGQALRVAQRYGIPTRNLTDPQVL